jgi:uncharacterized protein with PQ loop repeat
MSNLVMDLFNATQTVSMMEETDGGYRGETSVATYVLKVLGVAFICIAEMIQVVKIMRSKKTKNLSTASYALKSFAFLFLGIQSTIDVAEGEMYEIGWLCVYWIAFLAEMGLALFITSNKWN